MGAGGSASPRLVGAAVSATSDFDLTQAFSGLDAASRSRWLSVLNASEVDIDALLDDAVKFELTSKEGAANLKRRIEEDPEKFLPVWQKKVEDFRAKNTPEVLELRKKKDELQKKLAEVNLDLQQCFGERQPPPIKPIEPKLIEPKPMEPKPELISPAQNLRDDVSRLEKTIADVVAEIEGKASIIEIKIGGEPFKKGGWDNSGSTGYTWSYEVANESLVKVNTAYGGRDTTDMVGGGQDFEYEFHGVAPGVSLVKVSHGQQWDPNSVEKAIFKLHVIQPEEEELQEVLSKTKAKYALLAASLHKKRPDAKQGYEIDKTSPGLEMFTLQKAIGLIDMALKTAIYEDEQAAELEAMEKALDSEEVQLTSQISALRKQLNKLQDELQEVTGMAVKRIASGGVCCRPIPCAPCSGRDDPFEEKRRELESRKGELDDHRQGIKDLEKEIAEAATELNQAKEAKTAESSSTGTCYSTFREEL